MPATVRSPVEYRPPYGPPAERGTWIPAFAGMTGGEEKKKVAQELDGSCATFAFEPQGGPTIQLSSPGRLL